MIGRRLGVASLIEGSIMREGNRVRVVVQLYISYLGAQYPDAGDFEKAIEMSESVLRLYPEYPPAWLVGWFPQFRALHKNPLVIAKAEELGVPLQEGPH